MARKFKETLYHLENIWGSEQIAMNITMYCDNLPVEMIACHIVIGLTIDGLLKFDKIKNTLVEPYLPNHQIGIVHFAG